ncbi:MAG: ADP-ribosylglycohydrolase family protein [Planctomycetota bacterium]|nr:MAG: ADP-ribosylglycohydrolase family protein [Planctomycetota bacterium]
MPDSPRVRRPPNRLTYARVEMYATLLRKDHVAGVLLGTAIGEALGVGLEGLSRRAMLRQWENSPLAYSYWPRSGSYGEHTRLMLVAAQALLNSHNELNPFQRALAWRLSWYPLSFPVGISAGMLWTCMKCRFRRLGVQTGAMDGGRTDAATRAVFFGIALHGAGHRLPNWMQSTTAVTHRSPHSIDACTFLATLMNTAATSRYRRVETGGDARQAGPMARAPLAPLSDPVAVLQQAAEGCTTAELRELVAEMQQGLQSRWSVARLARQLGYVDRVPNQILPVTALASYAFLRHSGDYRWAVERAIRLGGATAVLGAIAGGLAGGYLGGDAIPPELIRGLRGGPHGRRWLRDMADRFAHWPHGVDDLYLAPAQTSDPIMQIVRNMRQLPASGVQRCKRVLWNGTTRSRRRR